MEDDTGRLLIFTALPGRLLRGGAAPLYNLEPTLEYFLFTGGANPPTVIQKRSSVKFEINNDRYAYCLRCLACLVES